MRVWLPYITAGSGIDTFTRTFGEHLEEAGHEVVCQPFPHALQYAPGVLRSVRAPEGVDIVFTNSWSGFALKRGGIPMVTMEQLCVHDPAYAPFRSRAQAVFHRGFVYRFERRTFDAADCVIAVSETTRQAISDAFGNVEATVIPNGVDTEFFTPEPSEPREGGKPFRLLFVGNLTVRKGADVLPRIMRQLGSGFSLAYTSGLRTESSLDVENARPLGRLDREGVRKAYRDSDALLFPTRLEGLPLVVLEAMACGVPVIGSNRSSMPEVVQDGVTGLLCNLDIEEFAGAVEQLAHNDAMRAEMARASRIRVEQSFGIRGMVENYVALFAGLL